MEKYVCKYGCKHGFIRDLCLKCKEERQELLKEKHELNIRTF